MFLIWNVLILRCVAVLFVSKKLRDNGAVSSFIFWSVWPCTRGSNFGPEKCLKEFMDQNFDLKQIQKTTEIAVSKRNTPFLFNISNHVSNCNFGSLSNCLKSLFWSILNKNRVDQNWIFLGRKIYVVTGFWFQNNQQNRLVVIAC